MSLEHSYYFAGIVSAIAAVLGLAGLTWYAVETRKIRKAAQDQLEGAMKPCVLLLANPYKTLPFDQNPLILKNVGNGVALNARYQMARNVDGPWLEAPALQVGADIETHMLLKHLLDAKPLICEFESLSGTRYRTESYISEVTTNLDLRHRFIEL